MHLLCHDVERGLASTQRLATFMGEWWNLPRKGWRLPRNETSFPPAIALLLRSKCLGYANAILFHTDCRLCELRVSPTSEKVNVGVNPAQVRVCRSSAYSIAAAAKCEIRLDI